MLDEEEEGSPSAAAAREAALQRHVAGRVRVAADAVAPVIAAVAGLVARRLSGAPAQARLCLLVYFPFSCNESSMVSYWNLTDW